MSAHELRCEAIALGRLLQTLREEGIVEGDDDALCAAASESNLIETADEVLRCLYELEAQKSAIAELIDTYKARKLVLSARTDRLRSALLDAMQTSGVKKLPLAAATVSVSAGRRSVRIVDRDRLPFEYWRYPPPEPNMRDIATAMLAGEDVPGAEWSNAQPALSIRAGTTKDRAGANATGPDEGSCQQLSNEDYEG